MSIYRLKYFFVFLLWITAFNVNLNVYSQVARVWDYSYSPVNNYEASGKSIVSFPSGRTVTAGIYRGNVGFDKRNILLFVDEAGALIDADTSSSGSGYRKVIYDGQSHFIAAATLTNDTLPISKIIIARFDTSFSNRQLIVPDSGTTSPGYDVMDLSLLSNSNIVVASHWDAFPLVCLSLLCVDSTGVKQWERIDSSFQFSYDVKMLADSSGGLYVAGSGRDTSTTMDFIFVAHYTSAGDRDWSFRYYSPQSFADMTDFIRDVTGHLYVSGTIMDSTGQVGLLMKVDTTGNIIWNNPVVPLSYSRIISDNSGNIYGADVPLNGIDVFTIDKLDSSGTLIDSSSFQLAGYFASELGDIKMLSNGIIAATGGLFVLSFPKSDLFLAAFDTSLNLHGYDIFDSLNTLGEIGRELVEGNDNNVYVCGRLNYENQFETSNIGLVKYDLSGIFTTVSTVDQTDITIFPNPASENLNLDFGNVNVESLIVYDIFGKEIFKTNNVNKNYTLNIADFPDGIYLLNCFSLSRIYQEKFIVLHQ